MLLVECDCAARMSRFERATNLEPHVNERGHADRQAGRQAGRQVYVCSVEEQRLLSTLSLPEAFADRIVEPARLVELIRSGQVAAVVIPDGVASDTLARILAEIRSAGAPIPVIELLPGDRWLAGPTSPWAHAAVATGRAHFDLEPVVRATLIERVLWCAGKVWRRKVNPVHPADVAICGVLDRRPPFANEVTMSRVVAISGDTLDRHWWPLVDLSLTGGDAVAPTLAVGLDWVLLLRAIEERKRGSSWDAIALSLDTTPKRLRRLSNSLCGVELSRLVLEEPVLPVRLLEERLLPWLRIELRSAAVT